MASSRNHVVRGGVWRPPSADLQNAWTDKAFEHRRSDYSPAKNQRHAQSIEVLVESTTAVSPGSVVGLSNPALLPTTNDTALREFALTSTTPVTGKWGVATGGISASGASRVVRMGYAWAQVNVTDVAHAWADIDMGVLTSETSGYARIESNVVSTGVQWCLLLLGFTDATSGGSGGMSAPEKACLCQILSDINAKLVAAGQAAVDISCLGCEATILCPTVSQEIPESITTSISGGILVNVTEGTQWAFDRIHPGPFEAFFHPGDSPCVRRNDGPSNERDSPISPGNLEVARFTLNVVSDGAGGHKWEVVMELDVHFTSAPGAQTGLITRFASATLADFTVPATLNFVGDNQSGLFTRAWDFTAAIVSITP